MIKYESNNGNGTNLEVRGSLKYITAEVALFVRHVWEGFTEKDSDAGDLFKELITKAFTDGIIFASEEEIGKLAEEAKAEMEKKKKDDVEDLKKALKDALKDFLEDL